MECRDIKEFISAYLENDLEKEKYDQLTQHFQECCECRTVKEALEFLFSRMPDLEEEVPFFLRNRLLNIPEHKRLKKPLIAFFPVSKWVAAMVGSILLFLNLFYFTNIFPFANRRMHSVVSEVEKLISKTDGWVEKLKESKNLLLFTFFNKGSVQVKDQQKQRNSVEGNYLEKGEKNG